MTPTLITFVIVCPLVFLAGFVDAVAGGGGLIALPAYMIAGLPVHHAIGTNKLSSGLGTATATIKLARLGYIPWRKTVLCLAMAMIGSASGARIALLIQADLFKKLMLVIIPVTAYYVMHSKSMDEAKEPFSSRETMIRSSAVAFLIGIYDGFYGPGTGTFLILLLSGFARLGLGESNGIAKSINLTTNITALAVYLMNGKVLLLLGLVAGLFGIAGNYIGVTFFEKKGSKAVKPIMLAVLVIFFIKILTELL